MAKDSGGGGDDTLFAILILLVVIAVVGFMVWGRYHNAIIVAINYVRLIELSPIIAVHKLQQMTGFGMVIPAILSGLLICKSFIEYKKGKGWGWWLFFGLSIGGLFFFATPILLGWLDFLMRTPGDLITFGYVVRYSVIVNVTLLVLVLLPMAFFVYKHSMDTNPTNERHFAKREDYNLHTFTDEMSKVYPHLELFRKINLIDQPVKSGWYRIADSEKEFAIKHGLLIKAADGYAIDRQRADEVFRSQLGNLWTGWNKSLSPLHLAVLATLLPRVAALDPSMSDADYAIALKETDRLLSNYWRQAAKTYRKNVNKNGDGSTPPDRLKISVKDIEGTIKKYMAHPFVLAYIQKHAYITTIIYAMLSDVRKLGVLPSSEYRWLRVVDRSLWLVINNVGRSVAFTETAGVVSHFQYERSLGKAVEKPMVAGAVKALSDAVSEYAFTAAENKEISKFLSERVEFEKRKVEASILKVAKKTLLIQAELLKDGQLSAEIVSESGEVINSGAVDRQRFFSLIIGHDVILFDETLLNSTPDISRAAASVSLLTEVVESVVPELYHDSPLSLCEQLDIETSKNGKEFNEVECMRLIWIWCRKNKMRSDSGQTMKESNE